MGTQAELVQLLLLLLVLAHLHANLRHLAAAAGALVVE
jgi:hypothetical protein